MKVFADFHHEGLFESLRILFEERLGWELYRPIGLDWYHEKYWSVYNHPATAEQYLGFHIGKNFKKMMNDEPNAFHTFRNDNWTLQSKNKQDIYLISSVAFPEIVYKGITLDTFKGMDFDILLSSMPQHIEPFNELIQKYQSRAKHIFQIGNNWRLPDNVRNILTSASTVPSSPKHNIVFYHQEFDLQLFCKKDLVFTDKKSVFNMMHIMQDHDLKSRFFKLESALPDWQWKAYGACNRDGPRGPDIKDIASIFQAQGVLWHCKKFGDGYGFNIHHAAATGTPLIIDSSFFKGMTAEALFIDGRTCVDLVKHSDQSATEMIKNIGNNYEEWSNNTYNRFQEVVNFNEEFEQVKIFLGNLI